MAENESGGTVSETATGANTLSWWEKFTRKIKHFLNPSTPGEKTSSDIAPENAPIQAEPTLNVDAGGMSAADRIGRERKALGEIAGIKSQAQLEAERLLRDIKNEEGYLMGHVRDDDFNIVEVPNQDVAVALEALLKPYCPIPDDLQIRSIPKTDAPNSERVLIVQSHPKMFAAARAALPASETDRGR